MTANEQDAEDITIYRVVVNHEGQYSIWPADQANPLGWNDAGMEGGKDRCLAYINEVWTDMRPLSLRKRMEDAARQPVQKAEAAEEPGASSDSEESPLVQRLCEGSHEVELRVRPQRTAHALKEKIALGYVHVRFTKTQGGTELGVQLDPDRVDVRRADFDSGTGMIHLEGRLTLDYVKLRCIADINLNDFAGTGHLERVVFA